LPRPTKDGSVKIRRRSCRPTTAFESGDDAVEVGQHRLRGLVAFAGVLAQQPLHDLIQGPRHAQTESPQRRRLGCHVLAQDLAQAVPREGRPAGQALEQHHARRVEVGALVHVLVEQPGLLGRHVHGRFRRDVPHGCLKAPIAGQAEIHQDRLGQGPGLVHHNVGRFEVTMEHTAAVRLVQGAHQAAANHQRFGNG
jgi:hypothetical protein